MWLFLAVFFLSVNTASAARIYGNVYDFSLNEAKNAEVSINTTPNQFMIAKNGTYSFDVANGIYEIEARQYQKNYVVSYANENVTVRQEGNYVLDLILFPEIETGGEDSYPIDVNENILDSSSNNYYILWIVLFLAVLSAFKYYMKRWFNKKYSLEKKDPEFSEESDLDDIVKIIKSEGGRATQKDIRKKIPLSEAKISLMIAELEHKGVVEKIKKGRGNIIILKK